MYEPKPKPVIWCYGSPIARAAAAGLAAELEARARLVMLGPPGDPAPHLDLGTEPDLALALESCPAELRPSLLAVLDGGGDTPGARGLCCGQAIAESADQVLQAALRGRSFAWLERVRVNLPLNDLLGRYRHVLDVGLMPEVGLHSWVLDGLDSGDLAQAKGLLAGRPLTCHLPFIDLAPASLDPLIAEAAVSRLDQAADWAIFLEAGQAVMHTGMIPPLNRDVAAFAERFARRVAPVAAKLEEANIPLALENVFELGPEPLLAARQALAEDGCGMVGLCFDLGHALAFSQTPLDEWFDALAPHLIEVHLHDNEGDDDTHLPPGRGLADWAMLKAKLAAMDTTPVLTLEPHCESHLWESLRGLEDLWGPPSLPD